MTTNDLAPPTATTPDRPTEAAILRLAEAIEQFTAMQTAADLELRCFTPEQAAEILGKNTNWVLEACRDGRIPRTYVGKSPRLTAAHIRWVQSQGERLPNKYAKPAA
ncbi:helix-turn-helix domain-containing protein [Streptomyces sp. MS06]|uniref:helix-turn-helix domain-containing protein n=1 Tax=Streptomyces sp. MS06 TaxID=3385974 RepID=UPI0039A3552E